MDYKSIKKLARELRKRQTRAEAVFWEKVRNRRFRKLKFNRQFVIGYGLEEGGRAYFIVDFYCHELELIIEIDGKIHEKQIAYDARRESILESLGFQILRFKNEEVLYSWEGVKKRLSTFIDS
ncbi:MAG: DUF559 domain-containing protein [Bacteroidia bacterium]|nr:DUF559 domain-containing protein [Bacteroidia bacterium]